MQLTEIENTNQEVPALADSNRPSPPGDEDPVEGDWNDEDDEDFDDRAEDLDDLHEIQVGDDIGEPDPEDADHLPDDDLQ
ncbi:hypothetical protein BH09BAC6_BH09BAC6_26220 [soil metagenome]